MSIFGPINGMMSVPLVLSRAAYCALVDVVIGTDDEINAAVLSDVSQMELTHSQISDTKVAGDTRSAIEFMLGIGTAGGRRKDRTRRRAHPSRATTRSLTRRASRSKSPISWARAMPLARDFIYGLVNGWGWYKSARLGNACGAIVVTEHGCANFHADHARDRSICRIVWRPGLTVLL